MKKCWKACLAELIATFTLALASGADMAQAARIANHAAGIVVGKLGVAVATPKELSAALGAAKVPRRPTRRPVRRPLSARR